MTEAITNGPRDHRGRTFAITSYTEDLSLASNESTAGNIAAVLGSLIKELKEKGVIEATIAT